MRGKRTIAMSRPSSPRSPLRNMPRRDFLKTAGAMSAGAVLPGLGLFDRAEAAKDKKGGPGKPPNLLFILVDEMRFPKVFPAGINTPGEFLARFMPNTFELWRHGVKFANHHTGGTACTPGRGTLVSGLYTQQSWLVLTILSTPDLKVAPQPVLNRAYPTYGKLLRRAGYRTPYIGKWHLSIPPEEEGRLEIYGFDGLTYPDPTGVNLQGTFGNPGASPPYLNDADTANQARDWLMQRRPGEGPWCLTVGFINPHDKEFFPAGTEFQTFTDLFLNQPPSPPPYVQYSNYSSQPSLGITWAQDTLNNPPSYGYPALPPNWESLAHLEANKPTLQTVAHQFCAMVWGGITDDSSQGTFSIVGYPGQNPSHQGIGIAPYSYWQRNLDSYTQILSVLDEQIGQVVAAMPRDVARDTIILFTSDHGEYAGAHGLVSGKVATGYDEALRVPLIVVDPTGRFTGDIDIVRTQLTSSVDFLPLIVSLGYNGSRDWMHGGLDKLYGPRHRLDLIRLLRSARAPGRPYVLFATDETIPSYYNYLEAPMHVTGVRTEDAKLCIYANWRKGTTDIVVDDTLEVEYYDYSTEGGRAEVDSTPDDPRAKGLLKRLLKDLIPDQLRAPLPPRLRGPQALTHEHLVAYLDLLDGLTDEEWRNGAAISLLGYGLNVP
jgi:arylsulfatase A-like enzyme